MKRKIINNLARRLQKKYPRLYSSMGTKRVKKVLGGIFGEKVFTRQGNTNNFRQQFDILK